MKLLAWDTSSKAGALVALEWDEKSRLGWSGVSLRGEWALNVDTTHSERLLWGVHNLLESVQWRLADIDLFGVGVGPGSFTGLRIGVTTARTLSHTLKKPLLSVSSLAALARPAALWARQASRKRVVVVVSTDACKGELYGLWGSAKSVCDCSAAPVDKDGARGLWKRGVEEQVLKPDELIKAVKRKLSEGAGDASWIAIGEGRKRYPDVWKKLPASREIENPAPFPDHVEGRYVGMLAWEAFQAGLAREGLLAHPRYLRASDAELKLKAGLLPPGPSRGSS